MKKTNKVKKRIPLLMSAIIIMSYTSLSFATARVDMPTDVEDNIAETSQDVVDTPKDEIVTPRTSPITYNRVANKQYQGYNHRVIEYWSDIWMKASKYEISSGTKQTATIQVSGSGAFTKSAVKATGVFTYSVTKNWSIKVTVPSESTKYSKFACKAKEKKYRADMYTITDFGLQQLKTKTGTGTVYEPYEVYAQVVYK